MIFLDYIDLYCERTASGFWNEPINALSNVAFLIAAWIAWRALQVSDRRGIMDYVLICLVACIGVGSFLFHTYANGQTELLDVIPIWAFVILYVATTVFRISNGNHLKTLRVMLIVIVCVGVSLWAANEDISTQDAAEPARLNGSLQYLPALVALWVFSIATFMRRHPARTLVIGATGCFTVSLGFRTVDLMTCDTTGVGTHFMWHFLNGSMVLGLLLALIRHVPPVGKQRRDVRHV